MHQNAFDGGILIVLAEEANRELPQQLTVRTPGKDTKGIDEKKNLQYGEEGNQDCKKYLNEGYKLN